MSEADEGNIMVVVKPCKRWLPRKNLALTDEIEAYRVYRHGTFARRFENGDHPFVKWKG